MERGACIDLDDLHRFGFTDPACRLLVRVCRQSGNWKGERPIPIAEFVLAILDTTPHLGAVLVDACVCDRATVVSAMHSHITEISESPIGTDVRGAVSMPMLIEVAKYEAQALGTAYVGTEHILLACVKTLEVGSMMSLASLGLTYERCREALECVMRAGVRGTT